MRLALILAALASAPACALACMCMMQPPLVQAAKSDAVFTGRVESVRDSILRFSDGGWTGQGHIVTMRVLKVWKGAPVDTTVIVWTEFGDEDCGVRFTRWAEYLVYASADTKPKRGWLFTSICARTRVVALAAADIDSLGAPLSGSEVPPTAK